MSEQTKIAWCDSTVNFWEGCTKVSEGCANCYAEARDKRFTGGIYWRLGRRRKSKSAVKDALAFNRKPWICDECGEASESSGHIKARNLSRESWCDKCGGTMHRRRIFSLSLGDWLDDEVSIGWLAEMLDTIRQCNQVTWILCSKRWENFSKRLNDVLDWAKIDVGEPHWVKDWLHGRPPSNIIGLCSVENQEAYQSRIAKFLDTPLACHGLSMEPLLGEIKDLNQNWYLTGHARRQDKSLMPAGTHTHIKWLIIGGESGPNARPCNVEWIRSLVAQGKAAGVATFVKQLGAKPEWAGWTEEEKYRQPNVTDKKGGDPAEWPADLRVQEWPKGF